MVVGSKRNCKIYKDLGLTLYSVVQIGDACMGISVIVRDTGSVKWEKF